MYIPPYSQTVAITKAPTQIHVQICTNKEEDTLCIYGYIHTYMVLNEIYLKSQSYERGKGR